MKSFSKFLILARACALNIIASHEHTLYCTNLITKIIVSNLLDLLIQILFIKTKENRLKKTKNQIRERERGEVTDSEHCAEDAEDDGDETRVIYGEILRGYSRSLVRPRRRR